MHVYINRHLLICMYLHISVYIHICILNLCLLSELRSNHLFHNNGYTQLPPYVDFQTIISERKLELLGEKADKRRYKMNLKHYSSTKYEASQSLIGPCQVV